MPLRAFFYHPAQLKNLAFDAMNISPRKDHNDPSDRPQLSVAFFIKNIPNNTRHSLHPIKKHILLLTYANNML